MRTHHRLKADPLWVKARKKLENDLHSSFFSRELMDKVISRFLIADLHKRRQGSIYRSSAHGTNLHDAIDNRIVNLMNHGSIFYPPIPGVKS